MRHRPGANIGRTGRICQPKDAGPLCPGDSGQKRGYHGANTTRHRGGISMKTQLFALGLVAFAGPALAQNEVVTRANVDYVEHDGAKLTGDLYLPKGVAKAPLIIGIHGGGWQGGGPVAYRHWGPYLAKNGFGMFAIKYRLAKEGTYPRAVYDVKSAVQFIRAKAGELGVD